MRCTGCYLWSGTLLLEDILLLVGWFLSYLAYYILESSKGRPEKLQGFHVFPWDDKPVNLNLNTSVFGIKHIRSLYINVFQENEWMIEYV